MNKYRCSDCVNKGSPLCDTCFVVNDGMPSYFVRKVGDYTPYGTVERSILSCIADRKPIPQQWIIAYNQQFRKEDE